jgi:predicted AAA+ superfamily ATPase
MNEVKQQCAISSEQAVLNLLTIVPKSHTVQRTADKLCTSKYMMNKAHELKKEQSITAKLAKNLGKTLPEITVQKAKMLYEDELFQMYPVKKECVKTTDLKGIHKQKILLLVNLEQLCLEVKAYHMSLNI